MSNCTKANLIDRLLFIIIPFALTCIPGYHINDTTTIQFFDLYFAVLLFVNFNTKSKSPLKNNLILWWSFFSFITILSVLIASILNEGNYVGAFLKSYRLLYPVILITFLRKRVILTKLVCNQFNVNLIYSMIISALIGIIGFVFQIDGYVASQTAGMEFEVLSRAGSFWQEAGIYGTISGIYVLIGICLLMKGSLRKTNRFILIFGITLNLVAVAFSSTRAAFVDIVVCLAYLTIKLGKNHILKYLISGFFLYFAIAYLYENNAFPALNFYIDRLSDLSSLDSKNAGSLSSGRFDIWANALNDYFRFSIIKLLFGNGYKADVGVTLADNGYIYVLLATGIIGFVCFTIFVVNLLNGVMVLKKKDSLYHYIANFIVIAWLVSMFFADTLTYIPVICFIFLFKYIEKSIKKYEYFNS